MSIKKLHKEIIQDLENKNPFLGREGLVYARVSSKKQELEGSGLTSQEGRCVNDLRLIGVPYIKTFPDTFTGGGDFMKRPAMRELIGYIDANPHKKFIVVFDDLKRFSRNVEFHFKLRQAFRNRQVLLRCLNYNFDESPEGEFAELIMSGQAQLERKQNQRQVIQKMKARLDLGYYTFGKKRGFDMVKNPLHGKVLVPNQDAKILKEALEGFASGIFVRQIDVARFLFENKFWERRTAEGHLTDVSNILRDVAYCGDIEYPKWGVARRPGKHKGIISVETFEKIQRRLQKDSSKAWVRQDISPEFPLRGLVLCSECKSKLTAARSSNHKKNPYYYYYCIHKGCSLRSKAIQRKKIEEDFRALVKRNAIKQEMDEILDLTFSRVWKEEVHDLRSKQTANARECERIEQEIRELTDSASRTRSDLVREQYEKRIEELAKELKDMKPGQNGDLKVPFRTAFDKATKMLKSPITIWDSVSPIEQQRLFFFLFDSRLTYSKSEAFRTSDSLSTARIFEEFCEQNSDDVDPTGLEHYMFSTGCRYFKNK
ncbi:recombinase family protein [Patescibacteria group bacterium]|nr:recombinase family protein [Patescibacteria group bacterium]